MKLFTTDTFMQSVLGHDGKELGTFVNLIMDTEHLEARMLVFPNIKIRRLVRQLVGLFKNISGDILEQHLGDRFDFIFDDEGLINKDKIDEGVKDAVKRLQDFLQGEEEKLSKIYFLVPVSEISEKKGKRIKLTQPKKNYFEYIVMPTSETDVCFYNDEACQDLETDIAISLNLVFIRGKKITDAADSGARIADVRFDVSKGIIDGLVVRRPGRGVRKRLIDVEDMDFGSLSCCKGFDEYSTLA